MIKSIKNNQEVYYMPRKKQEPVEQTVAVHPGIVSIDKKTENWTVSKLVRQISKNQIKVELDIQRGQVWNIKQKSLLIHSVILDYPIYPISAIRRDKNIIDILDGKQRSTTLFDFVNDKFKLKGFPVIVFDDGSEADYNGLKYSQLPEDIREIIDNYNVTITIFGEDTSYEQETDIFYRLNNGTSLTISDKNFSKAISKDMITSLISHPIFEKALTETALRKMSQRRIIISSYIMLMTDNLSLDAADVNKFLKEYKITDDDRKELNNIYDRLLNIANTIEETSDAMSSRKRVSKRILSRNGIPTLVRFMKNHSDDEKLTQLFISFFSGEKKATNNEEYNNISSQGSGHMANILRKNEILEEEYTKI